MLPTQGLVLRAVAWTAIATSALFGQAEAHHQTTQDAINAIDHACATHGVSCSMMHSVAFCESKYDPHATGSQGEIGLFQLHPRGELRGFYAIGLSDPRDVWENAWYAGLAMKQGRRSAWNC